MINMKYIAIVLLAFVAMNVTAQEKKPVQEIKSASIEKEVEVKEMKKENKAIYISSGPVKKELDVAYYDSYILALEGKMDIVKADELQNKKAIENGWFDEMNKNIETAKLKRNQLLIKK